MVKPVDVYLYRQYVLGKIGWSNYNLVYPNDLPKYINYTKYIQTKDPISDVFIYMVGYYINTIDHNKWMPVFNHDYGRLKEEVIKEIKMKHKEYMKRWRMNIVIGFHINYIPLELCHIICSFL